MPKVVIVGIDVSKATLDYTWTSNGKASQVTNNTKGIQSLVKKLKKIKPQIVVFEATGGYQNNLANALADAAIPYKIVNPRQVRDFARSLNRLAKTDKLDALTLVEYGASRSLTPDTPKSGELRAMSYLLLRRTQLQQMITMEKGHLENMAEGLKPFLFEHIESLKSQLKNINEQIRHIIKNDTALSKIDQIIQSVPGLGPVVSATIIADLPEIQIIGRKQVSALVGVAPFNRDSGKYRGQRHIYAGRSRVRNAIYCALRSCLMHNKVIKAWFDHLFTKGKPYKVACIACVRKIIVVLRSMLINQTLWEPQRYYN